MKNIILIDTHAHVNFSDFKSDSKEVIKRALDENIWMINVGAYGDASERAIEIANEYDCGVYAAVGQHPGTKDEFDYGYFLNLARNEKVVAIGECGLDFHRIENQASEKSKVESLKEKQKEVFIKQLKLAREADKPIIIHCRDAHEDLLEILNLEAELPSGVMHFFTGNLEQAKKYIELGFYISFSGVVTFPPRKGETEGAYDEIIKNIPLEKILVETDCPYVAPIPHRGKRNEPVYVKYVAQKIAELRGLSFDEVAEQTTQNAKNLFKVEIPFL